jgi:Uma2 family endonuclease
MEKKIAVDEYFRDPETNRPMELVYGYVREPPAPFFSHQSVVGKLFRLMAQHVEHHRLGVVCVSPLDVVLDSEAALVVQPDILFVAHERLDIVRERIWGAPDLVVEVASPITEHRDRTLKLAWYRRYGVKEYWVVDPRNRRIEIMDGESNALRSFSAHERVVSKVLPDFDVSVAQCTD